MPVHTADELVLDESLALRAFWARSGEAYQRNKATELTAHHLLPASIISRRLDAWTSFNPEGIPCQVLDLAVFTLKNAALKRRLVYLQFQRLALHEADTLLLEHFLVWPTGAPREIKTLTELTEALRFVVLWLVFLLGPMWVGVADGFLADVAARRFENFPIPYMLQHVYDALENISKVGRDEPTMHEEPDQKMRDAVATYFTTIRQRTDHLGIFEYSVRKGYINFGTAPAMPTTAPQPTASPITPLRPTNSTVQTPGSGSVQTGGVCYAALGEHYGHPNAKCRAGMALCPRLHFEQLPAGTTRTSLTAQLSGLIPGDLRTAVMEGIAADPTLSA